MKLVFDLLALVDLKAMAACNQIPIDVANTVIDLTLTSCVLLLLHPSGSNSGLVEQASWLTVGS